MHALNLTQHTPPLARFLTELSRAQSAQVTAFDWGAADAMPFLPRLRYGRVRSSPRHAGGSTRPNSPAATVPRPDWDAARRAGAPGAGCRERVRLARRRPSALLDLDRRRPPDPAAPAPQPHPRRRPRSRRRTADAYGWCGGRAHEVVVPLRPTRHRAWPAPADPYAGR